MPVVAVDVVAVAVEVLALPRRDDTAPAAQLLQILLAALLVEVEGVLGRPDDPLVGRGDLLIAAYGVAGRLDVGTGGDICV